MPVLALSEAVDLVALQEALPIRYPALLETGGMAGWDVLFALPRQIESFYPAQIDTVFARLEQLWQREQCGASDELGSLPFRGGWFVYLGYEMLHALEPGVPAPVQTGSFPCATLMRIPAAVLHDHIHQQTWLFAECDDDLVAMRQDIARLRPLARPTWQVEQLEEEDEHQFMDGVAAIQRYICAGDVFQVNLSRRWRGRVSAGTTPSMLYRALRQVNPAPFGGMVRLDDRHAIISSSPERLVSVRSGRVLTRPIAGTYARSQDPAQDANIKQALLAHPKERAEHVMLVDLERNDLGRVCQPGSVQVEVLMAVSSYAFVHHIESTVAGALQAGKSPVDVLRALFPGGTITGCPKVRTMQIVRELESSPRGAYTGSMGYINRDGDMDMNILIRSIMLNDRAIEFSAGAGIVADSVAQRELAETRAKALGMMRALDILS